MKSEVYEVKHRVQHIQHNDIHIVAILPEYNLARVQAGDVQAGDVPSSKFCTTLSNEI